MLTLSGQGEIGGKLFLSARADAPRIHLTGEQAVVLTCLTKAPQPLEQLEKATGLPAGKVLEALQVLEGMGLARPCPGGGYCRA